MNREELIKIWTRLKKGFYDTLEKQVDQFVVDLSEGKETEVAKNFKRVLENLVGITKAQAQKEEDKDLKKIYAEQFSSLLSLLIAIKQFREKISSGETTKSDRIRLYARNFKEAFNKEISHDNLNKAA